MRDRMLVRYFKVALCLIFILDAGFYYAGSQSFHCYCYIYTSLNNCCQSWPSNYCCTQIEATFRGSFCRSSHDCGSSTRPICCSVSKKCCTTREYDIETPRCDSITDCANVTAAPYCCDTKARCCTHSTYTKETCSSDRPCITAAKPRCCENSKCCSNEDYDLENCASSAVCDSGNKPHCCTSIARCCTASDYESERCDSYLDCKATANPSCCQSRQKCCPPASERLRFDEAKASAIAALSLVGLLSLSALCMGCAYTCGAKPAKRRTMVQAVVRPSQSRITATPTASLSSSRQPATPQTPPQYSVSAEYTSRPYRLPTEAKTPEWNDLPPSYDLATAGVSFRVAALPSGGS